MTTESPVTAYPMNDTPVTLPSGTVVRVRTVIVFEGQSGRRTLRLFVETPTPVADSARVAREANELIDRYGAASRGPYAGASVFVCRTQACLEMREAASEMFFFLPQPDGSWRAVAPPDV